MEFIQRSDYNVQIKFKYLLEVLGEHKIIHKAFVDKIIGSKFYELRIKSHNQIRILVYTLDHENFQESRNIILLNGFLKRSNTDYKKAIEKANSLINKYIHEF